ncbi:MAG TPA: immunoglobulin domain-containing protein, partial [Candidatus Dormibacteraeota bacterium]|nr:immunoglobulin domain-containing protein [Candidatus Dormibacteraeota bacterium]
MKGRGRLRWPMGKVTQERSGLLTPERAVPIMMTRLILISGLLVGYGLRAQEPPTIVTQPVNRTNVMGTPAAFAVEVLGTEPLYYQWFFNRTNPVEHGTNAALDLPFVQPAQAGLYHATITNTA